NLPGCCLGGHRVADARRCGARAAGCGARIDSGVLRGAARYAGEVKRAVFSLCIGAGCTLGGAGCSREPPALAPRPNIVLVTIDTLRADRVTPALMPTIDRVAARGARFVNARTTVPLTLPAHTSILTGLVPPADGVRTNGADRLGGAHPTIAGLLKS